jgi:hypothetical protein
MTVGTVGAQKIDPLARKGGDSDGAVKIDAQQPKIYDTTQPQTQNTRPPPGAGAMALKVHTPAAKPAAGAHAAAPAAGAPATALQEPGAQGNLANTLARDEANGDKIDHLRGLEQTGYPQDTKDFYGRVSDLQRLTVSLSPGLRDFYAGATGALAGKWGETADPAQHAALTAKLDVIENSARADAARVSSDPHEATLAVFNPPRGTGYLDGAGQQGVKELSKLRQDYLTARTPAEHQAAYNNALQSRGRLQDQISTAVDKDTTQEQSKWDQANKEVDGIIKAADAVTNDPGKRVEVIARQLHTTSPGSGRDDSADRRILAFTERLGQDQDLRDKIHGWEFDAGIKMNAYGVDSGKSYLNIPNNLPAPGGDYVRDLGDQYDSVLKDNSYKNYSITPAARAEKLVNKIAEGTVRFALGMTPFAPLTGLLDKNSVLTADERNGIDWGSGFAGLAMGSEFGELGKIAKPISKIIQGERFADELGTVGGEVGKELGGGARALLKADPGSPGVFMNDSGQHLIQSGNKYYPVRFDADNNTWRVYDPDNPARRSVPVERSGDDWRVHNDVGLKGGMDNGGAAHEVAFDHKFNVAATNGAHASPEMLQALNPHEWSSPANRLIDQPAFTAQHEAVFNRMPPEERRAIREWTHIDNDSETYSDASGSYRGVNFELNDELYKRHYSEFTSQDAALLNSGLKRLPRPPGESRLLRIAEVPPNYQTHFAPGDLVTNSPAFMSASSDNEFSLSRLDEDRNARAAGKPGAPAFAVFDIRSRSATPVIGGVTTLADPEREWIFRPNTVFRVEEVVTASPTGSDVPPRIGIRMVEVPVTQPVYAKNIHTGQLELVYPAGAAPTYATLKDVKQPSLQVPPPRNPNAPPPPAHGDPNHPGPSTP